MTPRTETASASTETDVSHGSDDQFVFSPDSMIWQVFRERATRLAPARACLLQVLHPTIAHAFVHQGEVEAHPIRHVDQSYNLLLQFIFATRGEILDLRKRFQSGHDHLHDGRYPNPDSPYAEGAFLAEGSMQFTVYTMYDSALAVYEELVHPLTEEEKEQFYQDCKVFHEMAIGDRWTLPQSLGDFEKTVQDRIETDGITFLADSYRMAEKVIPLGLPNPWGLTSKALTSLSVDMLPSEIRDNYRQALGITGKGRNLRPALKKIVARTPKRVRYAKAYRNAMQRLAA